MGLLIWLVVGATCGFLWSRRMANGSLADVGAGAAGGVLGGLLFSTIGWAQPIAPTWGDVVGPLIVALLALAAWRVLIGRRV